MIAALPTSAVAKDQVNQPLVLVVSLARQTMQVFRGTEVVVNTRISSGRDGHRTPTGVYSILQKNRQHFSNLYGGAPMPFMQRITWSGIALHAGALPGYPASHGCIRLPPAVAKDLFAMTAMGGRVIVSDQPLEPRLVAHASLFRPLPLGDGDSSADAGSEQLGGPHGQGRRIASAEGGPLVGLASAPAPADLSTLRRPHTQLEARRMREAERAGFETAITSARSRRADAESELAQLKTAIAEVQKTETQTLRETERLAEIKKKAEAMAAEARRILEKEYAEITPDTELPPERIAELEEREKALDALLMDRDGEARLAQEEHSEATAALTGARTGRAEIEARFAALRTAIVDSAKELAQAEQALKEYERRMRSRDLPISIFVSARTGKVDVRQGFNIIHEAPVELVGGATALGTHVFTAVGADGTRTAPDLRWSVVTPESGSASASRLANGASARKTRGRGEPTATISAPAQDTPTAALERVRFGEETRQLIAELIRPGSSLIVTDRAPSNETGKYTDVIVDIR